MSEAIKCPTSRFLDEARSQVAGIYSATGLTPKKILEQRNELLEMLQGVLKIERGSSGRIILEGWHEDAIRAAIAKATGEQA